MRKRFEGETTIYVIEGQWPPSSGEHYRGIWSERNLSPIHFGERHAKHNENWDIICPFYKEYGAGGACWQKTGINGFLNENMAWEAIDRVIKHAPRDEYISHWRLVRRTIKIDNEVLREGTPVSHGKKKKAG